MKIKFWIDVKFFKFKNKPLKGGPGTVEQSDSLEDFAGLVPPKKSQNTTEVIYVPSSEHVAEIVGKQGNAGWCLADKKIQNFRLQNQGAQTENQHLYQNPRSRRWALFCNNR